MAQKTIEIHNEALMRLVAQTGSGHPLPMDDATGDTGARPTELVLAGLGGCTGMDVLSILRKRRLEVARFDVRVRATQRTAYPQIFTDIDVEIDVEGPGITEAAVREAIELSARKYCSVSAMLAAGDTAIHHRYRVTTTGAEPSVTEGEVGVSGPFARPDPL
jgi:putative redox protein